MKLIIALFLCGVVYATASPCSEKLLDQCGFPPEGDNEYQLTEAFLNDMCRSVDCQENYRVRCGTTDLSDYKQLMLKLGEKILNGLCGPKNKAMRQKYLDNAFCLMTIKRDLITECQLPTGSDMHDPKYCLSLKEYISCTSGLLIRKCGNEAKEVYEALTPDYEFVC